MTTPTTSGYGPGRLNDPDRTIAGDPRTDPRLVRALAPLGLDGHPSAPPVTPESPRWELLDYLAAAEVGFETVFQLAQGDPDPIAGVVSETATMLGPDGQDLLLYVHRPERQDGPLPGLVHLHGGGMVILRAAGVCYTRWRQELAATGLVVIGVEFRNGADELGAHPFPAGLDDCTAAVRWVHRERARLGISHLVLTGESGGANLALAATLRAHREGWSDRIAGVYAQCPYIRDGRRPVPPELRSPVENDEYFISCSSLRIMAEAYDPGSDHADDPTCWPFVASPDDLRGLPPHTISVNELDPLRDEGLDYHRRLLAAGVDATARTVHGTCHAADVIFRAALPDVYASTIRDISGFAHAL